MTREEPRSSASQSRIQTIPVPPRAEGGWIGTLTASFVLGAEVLGALISGPVLAILRRLGRATDSAVRSVPGATGGLLRLGLLLFSLACLGGLVSFVILTLTTLKL